MGMSVHSRYKHNADKLECKVPTFKNTAGPSKPTTTNRYQRRAVASAKKSKRGLLVIRKGR